MAGSFLTKEVLDTSLLLFSNELKKYNIENFIFFGTLLGLTRNHSPIPGDDDVDFYVHESEYEKVQNILLSMGISIDYNKFPNHTKHFIQAHFVKDNKEYRTDFYFYNSSVDNNFILEYWNFLGIPNGIKNEFNVLKLPKPLVYPIQQKMYMQQEISIPKYPEIICEFLYGYNWKIPRSKGIDYHTSMLGGRPINYSLNEGKINLLE